jgi:hypothetical protein
LSGDFCIVGDSLIMHYRSKTGECVMLPVSAEHAGTEAGNTAEHPGKMRGSFETDGTGYLIDRFAAVSGEIAVAL